MASPELPRIENEKHSMANDGSLDIFLGVSSGTRVNINLKFFMVITAVLCWVKRLLVVLEKLKEFSSFILQSGDKDKLLLSRILCHSIFRELDGKYILLVGDLSPKKVVFFL